MENKITAIVTFIFFFLITFMGVIIMTPIVDAFAGQLPAELWNWHYRLYSSGR